MMTKLSKWLLYIASYRPLYVMLAVKVILGMEQKENETFWLSLTFHIKNYFVIICVLAALFIASVICYIKLFKFKNNTRY